MPIGSNPGEKRGGRVKGTPNRKTAERLAIAAEAEKRLAALLGAVPGDANSLESLTAVTDRVHLATVDAADGAMPLADALVDCDRTVFSGNALAYLQSVYRDPRLPRVVRMDAAKSVLRYETPALSATTVTADADSLALWRGADARVALTERVATVLMRAGASPRVHDVCDTSGDTSA